MLFVIHKDPNCNSHVFLSLRPFLKLDARLYRLYNHDLIVCGTLMMDFVSQLLYCLHIAALSHLSHHLIVFSRHHLPHILTSPLPYFFSSAFWVSLCCVCMWVALLKPWTVPGSGVGGHTGMHGHPTQTPLLPRKDMTWETSSSTPCCSHCYLHIIHLMFHCCCFL